MDFRLRLILAAFCTRSMLGILAVLFACFSQIAYAERQYRILIVSGSDEKPYRETIKGFKDEISASVKVNFSELNLMRKSDEHIDIEQIKPDVVFTLGSESLSWAVQRTSRIPIVATMVLKEAVLKQAPNVTGVSLSHSMQIQIQWLKRFFPQQNSIAVLYNPEENAGTVQQVRHLSQQAGLNLIAIPVLTHKELPYALEQLENNIQLLFAIPDETVMSAATAKEVLLASFRNKVPLIGLSENWVKSGAFYALSWDYYDLGRQCAELTHKVINGVPVMKLSPEHPRKQVYSINTKIAEHMNLEFSSDLISHAKEIFN